MNRGIDGLLYIGTVKVDRFALGKIVERSRETENIPEQRARGRDLVNVKARVGEHGGIDDVLPNSAAGSLGGVVGGGQLAHRRERQVLVHVVGVATLVSPRMKVGSVRGIEVEKFRPVIKEGNRGDWLKLV